MNESDMCHVMIDLETLGTRSNAVILSIGAAQFDLRGNVLAIFHKGISIESCLQAGLQVDGSTIEWWLSQSKESIDRLLTVIREKSYDNVLGTILAEFEQGFYFADKEKLCIWSHGSNFDIVLLENAYRAIGQKAWWKYSNVRDTRTLFDVANYKYTAKGGHDALKDAMSQAKAVQEAYQQLIGGKKDGSN